MFGRKTVGNRFIAALFAGLVIGTSLAVLTSLLFGPQTPLLIAGIAVWYVLISFVVALLGLSKFRSILRYEIPIWTRSLITGGSMTLVLVIVAYPVIAGVLASAPDWWPLVFQYPWWIVPNGVIGAYLIDWFATKTAPEEM